MKPKHWFALIGAFCILFHVYGISYICAFASFDNILRDIKNEKN